MTEIRFDQLAGVPRRAGYYEIYMAPDCKLKCGIGVDIRRRLRQHRSSHENGLVWTGDDRTNPQNARSKRSILTKHLYFDRELAPELDFTSQNDRRQFLLERCFIRYVITENILEAEIIEAENEEDFLYHGPVICRP